MFCKISKKSLTLVTLIKVKWLNGSHQIIKDIQMSMYTTFHVKSPNAKKSYKPFAVLCGWTALGITQMIQRGKHRI